MNLKRISWGVAGLLVLILVDLAMSSPVHGRSKKRVSVDERSHRSQKMMTTTTTIPDLDNNNNNNGEVIATTTTTPVSLVNRNNATKKYVAIKKKIRSTTKPKKSTGKRDKKCPQNSWNSKAVKFTLKSTLKQLNNFSAIWNFTDMKENPIKTEIETAVACIASNSKAGSEDYHRVLLLGAREIGNYLLNISLPVDDRKSLGLARDGWNGLLKEISQPGWNCSRLKFDSDSQKRKMVAATLCVAVDAMKLCPGGKSKNVPWVCKNPEPLKLLKETEVTKKLS